MGGLPPALRLVGIGWYVAFCITLGVIGGVWLDSKLDSSPVLTLAGLFLGLLVAFWGAYRMLMDVISAIGPKKRG
jgi:ATP synthase protein I